MNQTFFSSLRAAVVIVAGLLAFATFNAHAYDMDLSGRNYDAPEARRYQRVRVGVIEDIRITETTRESRNGGNMGAVVGGIAGALISQFAGQGKGRMIAATAGGALGAMGGNVIGNYVARERKVTAEIIVTLNNGDTVAIVQEVDQDTAQLRPNDRVRLIEGQNVRVVKMRTPTPADIQPSGYYYN